jgi:dTDP-4-dehydrorhamnose reductase
MSMRNARALKPTATSRAARPANSRLDLSRQVFGVTTPSWQQALRRELEILVQRG